jgi:hypothetical protein
MVDNQINDFSMLKFGCGTSKIGELFAKIYFHFINLSWRQTFQTKAKLNSYKF